MIEKADTEFSTRRSQVPSSFGRPRAGRERQRRSLFWMLCVTISFVAAVPPSRGATDLVAALGVETLPEGCGNPFVDIPSFMAFFDSSLKMMAAKRGSEAKGVADLFAVSALRDEVDRVSVSPTDESALQRLIVSQLCEYQKIEAKNILKSPKSGGPLQILSSDDNLLDHLASIAPKLYRDSRKLVVEALADRARLKQKDELLASKMGDINRAREAGKQRVRDLFD